ncbi:MinD/ParA family ATP-binding protein [Allosalinactinospora lopnorensis]|uniref:MinD/ParA family ATP-binding protein n=1 Tax=Allosalinactinospora lopnorensis TaxID=1352348 RepID=UPI00373FCBED
MTRRPAENQEKGEKENKEESAQPEEAAFAASEDEEEPEPDEADLIQEFGAPPDDPEPLANRPELSADALIPPRRRRRPAGWRRAVRTATLGLVRPGDSRAEVRRRELAAQARTQVRAGHYRVAVLSLKGGVGKTTTTAVLGSTLASVRGDRVIAVDANPDRGTLSEKIGHEPGATLRDLLNAKATVQRYADLRAYTSQAESRLEVLASDRDPAASEAFSEQEYREVARILETHFSICLTDCGTGLLHSAMRGILGLADQVVLVSSISVDGAKSASATLDWLEAHGHTGLARNAVVVLSRTGTKNRIDLDRLNEHFIERCREVVQVPWDPHLGDGADVELDRLRPHTRDAYLELAAAVAEGFALPDRAAAGTPGAEGRHTPHPQ